MMRVRPTRKLHLLFELKANKSSVFVFLLSTADISSSTAPLLIDIKAAFLFLCFSLHGNCADMYHTNEFLAHTAYTAFAAH